MIDPTKLLEHMARKQTQYAHLPLVAAVLEGLTTAIKRGDFEKEDAENGISSDELGVAARTADDAEVRTRSAL